MFIAFTAHTRTKRYQNRVPTSPKISQLWCSIPFSGWRRGVPILCAARQMDRSYYKWPVYHVNPIKGLMSANTGTVYIIIQTLMKTLTAPLREIVSRDVTAVLRSLFCYTDSFSVSLPSARQLRFKKRSDSRALLSTPGDGLLLVCSEWPPLFAWSRWLTDDPITGDLEGSLPDSGACIVEKLNQWCCCIENDLITPSHGWTSEQERG